MDTNKMRPISDATNIEANGWKSKDSRNMIAKRIADSFINRGHPSWTQNIPKLLKFVERLEEEVFNSARDEAEYIARISAKMNNPVREPLQSDESNLLPATPFGSGAETVANTEWREQLYQKIETMKSKYFKKLDILYKGLNRRYEQLGYVSQPPKIHEMAKCEHHKRALENTFALFQVNKSEITPDFEQTVDKIEKYINSITKPKYVSSQLQISQVEATSTNIPTSQVMGPHNSHFTQPNSHQVAIQSSTADPQEESVKQQGYGNVVQQQTSGEITPPVISTSGILASPLLENCNEENENCQDHIVISDDPSPAMQHLINVMDFVSAEALVDSCEDIGVVFNLNDGKSTLEPLNGPSLGAIGSDLEGVNVTDSQARYLTRRKFAPRKRNMNLFINSMPASEFFLQLTSSEKLFSNSSISQENNALSEEIKEINMRLIDTEVVFDKEKIFTTAAEGYIDHGEGLTVKLLFNSVSVNVNPMLKNHGSYKKPIIQPLWLHIPASYPHCSVVIVDEMPLEASKDLDEDLSMKAKLKLTLCLQRLSQPLSLKDIAVSWDRCAREAICDYAQLFGGGTFTSKYGGWEICRNDN